MHGRMILTRAWRFSALVLAAAIGAVYVGVSSSSARPGLAERGASTSLTWGVASADIASLNPFKFYDQCAPVCKLVYETLTQAGSAPGSVAPELATSWKQTGPKTWIFQIRHGVRFSNGQPLTARDVAESWHEWLTNPEYSFSVAPATGAKAIGKYAVQFSLNKPDAEYPAVVELPFVLPAKQLLAKSLNLDSQTLGTGPYVVKSHISGVSWSFGPNPHYWGKGLPKIKNVTIRLINNEASLESALRGGTVDVEQPANIDAAKALAGGKVKVAVLPTTDLYYLAVNAITPTEDAFKDQRVRQAVNLAINRREIIDQAQAGEGQATGVPTSSFADGCNASKVPGFSPNLAQARSLLQQSGVSGITTNLYISPATGAVAAPQIAQVIKEDLAQIGITVNIVNQDVPSWADTVFTKSAFSLTLNWWSGFGDPTHLVSYWNPSVAGFDKGFLADDPTLDALILRSENLPQGKTRTAVFQQICSRVATNANIIPLVTKPLAFAYRADRVAPALPRVLLSGWLFPYLAHFRAATSG